MKRLFGIVLAPFLAAAVTVCAADAGKPVPLSETPSAVQKTISVKIGDGKLGEINRVSKNDETAFEVNFTTKSGDDRDVTVADDGTLLSLGVELAETPAAVQRTIQSQAGGWTVDSIDKNVVEAEVSYDIEATKADRIISFSVASNGALSSREVALTETPPVVQAVIKSQLVDARLKFIDKNFDAAGNSFDIEAVAADGSRKSFSVAADGQLLSEEVSLGKVLPQARKTI